ncbi:MAG: hypothetical protein Q9169_002515 [Polycauliona sp. 2 TL-2023]
MTSLASTIVPIHSDASTFTSVTTSPMDFQDALDLPPDLKIPFPDSETPSRTRLDGVDMGGVERRTLPDSNQDSELTGSSRQDQRGGTYAHPHGEPYSEDPEPVRYSSDGGARSVSDERPYALAEVRDIIALKQYYQNRLSSQQCALENLTRTCGINGRLIPSLGHAHRAMADCFQNGDSTGFAKIYRTCENLMEAEATHPVEASTVDLEGPVEHTQAAPMSWFERLPQDCQEGVINFLSDLRTDNNSLAHRLSSLSCSELMELLGRSHTSRRPQSIFQGQPQRSTVGHSRSLPSQETELILKNFRNFHQGDPFFILFHGIFRAEGNERSKEQYLKNQIWSTACARIIADGRPGSDDFTTCTLDAFSDGSTWSLTPRLETYISQVLQAGAFLVDPASRESSDLKEPLEIRNANAVIAKSNFFDQALKDLLDLLLSFSPVSMLPAGLHTFISCTLGKIHNAEVRKRARNFIVSKWFVSSILAQALTNPEEYGIMMSHHIGATARNSILREIASRLQKQVYDVIFSWKFAAPILDLKMHSLTEQLLSRFDDLDPKLRQESPPSSSESSMDETCLVLSAHDITGLIRALYPKLLDSSSSANPSTAGSSTLVSGSIWRGDAGRSIAPSLDASSFGDANSYKTGPQSWNAHVKPLATEAEVDMPNMKAGDNFRTTDEELLRTYRCLTSTLQPLPISNMGIASSDWALFKIGDDGNVRNPLQDPSSGEGLPHQNDDTADRGFNVVEAPDDPIQRAKVAITRLLSRQSLRAGNFPHPSLPTQPHETRAELEHLVQGAIDQASTRYDYQDLHFWWQAKLLLQELEGSTNLLLKSIHEDCQRNMRINRHVLTAIDRQLYRLASLRDSQNRRIADRQQQRKAFRMKMWYVSDVRHSSTFEDALHVTQALRAMADSSRSKQPTGVANWARNRLRNVVGHDRTSAQTLDALTEPNEYSGMVKLNDDQVERTTRWLTRNSVENFCRGEERIHRFCLEVQKCANKLTGPTLLESPVLWSSPLFEQEKKAFGRKAPNTYEQHPRNANDSLYHASNVHLMASLPTFTSQQSPGAARKEANTQWMRSTQGIGRAGLGSSKTQPNPNDAYAREPIRSLPFHVSHTSLSTQVPIWPDHRLGQSKPVRDLNGSTENFAAEIKKGLYSLVLSDLGYLLWHTGTETDSWLRQHALDDTVVPRVHGTANPPSMEDPNRPGQKCMKDSSSPSGNLKRILTTAKAARQDSTSRWRAEDKVEPNTRSSTRKRVSRLGSEQSFPYRQTYKAILERFSMSDDPQEKLQRLHELEQLISHSVHESRANSFSAATPGANKYGTTRDSFHLKSMLVPRTKATSFEEVMANCTERRAGTTRFKNAAKTPSYSPDTPTFGTDEIVDTLLSIFRDAELRPGTLFRDLQYIAAFVPAGTLDQTSRGKAFWDAGLAALAFKQELCDAMITRATDITSYHISASSSSSPDPPPSVLPADLANTGLRDAAELWIIAAKEGSATAARELGLLYLTHPELLPRTTLQPFSKPKEVFRTVGAKKEGSIAEEGRLDPVTFAVVFHWMEVAANGGDKDARDFLRGNGEWGSGR